MVDCKDMEGKLLDYLYEELEATEKEAFQVHIASCVRCRGQVDAYGRVRVAARESLPLVEPSAALSAKLLYQAAQRRPRGKILPLVGRVGRHPAYAIAATFVVVGGFASWQLLHGGMLPETVAPSAAVATPVAASPPAGGAPIPAAETDEDLAPGAVVATTGSAPGGSALAGKKGDKGAVAASSGAELAMPKDKVSPVYYRGTPKGGPAAPRPSVAWDLAAVDDARAGRSSGGGGSAKVELARRDDLTSKRFAKSAQAGVPSEAATPAKASAPSAALIAPPPSERRAMDAMSDEAATSRARASTRRSSAEPPPRPSAAHPSPSAPRASASPAGDEPRSQSSALPASASPAGDQPSSRYGDSSPRAAASSAAHEGAAESMGVRSGDSPPRARASSAAAREGEVGGRSGSSVAGGTLAGPDHATEAVMREEAQRLAEGNRCHEAELTWRGLRAPLTAAERLERARCQRLLGQLALARDQLNSLLVEAPALRGRIQPELDAVERALAAQNVQNPAVLVNEPPAAAQVLQNQGRNHDAVAPVAPPPAAAPVQLRAESPLRQNADLEPASNGYVNQRRPAAAKKSSRAAKPSRAKAPADQSPPANAAGR